VEGKCLSGQFKDQTEMQLTEYSVTSWLWQKTAGQNSEAVHAKLWKDLMVKPDKEN
jgi:hypothetical protein